MSLFRPTKTEWFIIAAGWIIALTLLILHGVKSAAIFSMIVAGGLWARKLAKHQK